MAVPIKYNIRNLVVRKVSTGMTIAGFALVVGIFVVVMAMVNGLETALVSTGSPDNVIVMGKGSESEISSMILQTEDAIQIVSYLQGIQKSDKEELLVSPEHLASISMEFGGGEKRSLSIRGVKPLTFTVHDKVKIVKDKGRMPAVGMWEVMVGKAMSQEFSGLDVGGKITFSGHSWDIVGVFEAEGSSFESEIWADLDILRVAREARHITSIVIKTKDATSLNDIIDKIGEEQRIQLQAAGEVEYYSKQNTAAEDMKTLGYAIAIIMSLGAIFGAMNTMYASISERIKEIGTLRAIGFSKRAILFSFIFESFIMGLFGGIIGCIFSMGMNGYSMSITGKGFTALAFQFHVSLATMAMGLVFAVIMGVFGGLLPAANAARLPIIRSLREI